MREFIDPLAGSPLRLPPEEAELFRIAVKTHTANASALDGSVSVDVSADGTVHRWRLTDTARRVAPDQLVSTVIELIGKARTEAHDTVRTDFGLQYSDETQEAPSLQRLTPPVPAPAVPPPTTQEDDAWDDDEDYYHRGKSRIRAD